MIVYQLTRDFTIVLQNHFDIPRCCLGCFTEYNTVICEYKVRNSGTLFSNFDSHTGFRNSGSIVNISSPYLIPLLGLKKFPGTSLTRTEKVAVVIHSITQLLHFSETKIT